MSMNIESGFPPKVAFEGISVCVETSKHDHHILRLTNEAFGPGRYAKTAERIRENNSILRELSFVACQEDELMGSVRLWSLRVEGASGENLDGIAFLGPIVVSSKMRSIGLGRHLVQKALQSAKEKSYRAVILVGALSYFGSLGFTKAKNISLCGPVDPDRVLILSFDKALDISGRAR